MDRESTVGDDPRCTPTESSRQSPEPEDYFQQQWDDAMQICQDTLDDVDIKAISQLDTFDKLVAHLSLAYNEHADKTIPRILGEIKPSLKLLQKFSVAFVVFVHKATLATAAIWGLLNLLIEASVQYRGTLEKVRDMIDELAHHAGLFVAYQDFKGAMRDMRKAFIDVFVDIFTFTAHALTFLREKPRARAVEFWHEGIGGHLTRTSEKISKRFTRIKEIANVSMLKELALASQSRNRGGILRAMESETASDMPIQEIRYSDVAVPCQTIGLRENRDFCLRSEILHRLHEELDHVEGDVGQRCFGLWGLAGMGKSQIACSYAWRRFKEGLPAVFWINSETPLEIDQSFTKIALELKLDGANRNGNDEANKNLVIKWLEGTSLNWLIVFDNVENTDLVLDCWPESIHGSILLTSRREIVAMGLIGFEVPLFDQKQGAQFLITLSHQGHKFPEELAAAEELSILLGGLPLALTLAAMHMRSIRHNFRQYLLRYRSDWDELFELKGSALRPHYKHGLDTVWQLSFSSLKKTSPEASALFGVLSLMAPQDIPSELFERASDSVLHEKLKFCNIPRKFGNTIELLLDLALINKDPEANTFTVHRLIQHQYRHRMTNEERREFVKIAVKLLHNAFPRLGDNLSLRPYWETCKKYVQHIISIATLYEQFHLESGHSVEYPELVDCLSGASWYFFESGSWAECSRLVEIGLKICEDKTSLLYADFLNVAGILAGTRKRSKEAFDQFEESRKLRTKLLPENHVHIANIYNNLANEELALGLNEEALQHYLKAIEIDDKNPKNEELCYRYLNVASAHMMSKRFAEAKEQVEAGRKHAGEDEEAILLFDEMASWDIANIFYFEGSLDLARSSYEECWKANLRDNPVHPMVSASLYRMACVDLQQGRIVKAISILEQAKELTEYNEATQGNKADIARVYRKLADAFYQSGEVETAKRLHKSAEEIRKAILGREYSAAADNEAEYDRLVAYYSYYYR